MPITEIGDVVYCLALAIMDFSRHKARVLDKFSRIVFIISAIIWFALLGYRDLIEPDEARYAETPREMVVSGDWLTPRLNGFKYFEKPPLQYWLTAVNYELFGVSNASARLWLVTGGFLCGLFIWFLGTRLYDQNVGITAMIITLSSFLFTILGHYLTLDMSVTLFMTVGVGCLLLGQEARATPARNRNWMLLGWTALAAAVLTKGLMGIVLPGLAVFLYMLWQRDWAILRYLHLGKGLALLLAITVPWFVAVSRANPEFAHFFFIHEHFERYTTHVSQHVEPIYFFVPILLMGVSPWLSTSLGALFRPGFSWRPPAGEGFNAERFMWVYVVSIFLFFSFGGSKLPSYILPIFPMIGLLAARRLHARGRVVGDHWVMLVLALILLLAGIFAEHFAAEFIPAIMYTASRPWLLACAAMLVLAAAALFVWAANVQKAILTAGLCVILGFQMLLWGYQSFAGTRSSSVEAQVIKEQMPGAPVYAVATYAVALPFYLKRKVTMVWYKGELEMGIDAEPRDWIPTLEAFAKRWQHETRAVAVMEQDTYQQLKQMDVPMYIIYQGPRRLVVTRQ